MCQHGFLKRPRPALAAFSFHAIMAVKPTLLKALRLLATFAGFWLIAEGVYGMLATIFSKLPYDWSSSVAVALGATILWWLQGKSDSKPSG